MEEWADHLYGTCSDDVVKSQAEKNLICCKWRHLPGIFQEKEEAGRLERMGTQCLLKLKKVVVYFSCEYSDILWMANIHKTIAINYSFFVRVAMIKESISQSTLSLSARDFSSLNCDLCWYTLDLFCRLMLNSLKIEICVENKWLCDHLHMLLLHISA